MEEEHDSLSSSNMKYCCREQENDPFVMSLVDRIPINRLTLQQEISRLTVKKNLSTVKEVLG